MTLAAALLADLAAETALTRRLLAAVPEGRFDWKPHAKSMTLGQLASHLAEAPSWTPAMIEPEMDFADMGDYRPLEAKDRAELLAALDRNVDQATAALRGRDDAFLQATWTGRRGDRILMQGPRHQIIRQTIVHHCIQHRGQLSVYLRLCDVPVPQTYGPTADYPEW